MKRILEKSLLCTLYIVTLSLLLAGCKNENAPADKTAKPRQLTIKMSDGAAGTSIRRIKDVTITDEGSTLLAEWTAGDAVSCCNLSTLTAMDDEIITGTLTATTTGRRSDLTGTVECMDGDYLAIVYPAVSMAESYEMGDNVHGKFTISLASQDGTLERLASTYHYNYGRAHIISATETIAEATMDPMQSLLTVCKFSFVEKDHESDGALPIETLTISYGGDGGDKDTYPQSATVEVTNLTVNSAATAVGVASGSPLTINAGGATEVYVALLPEIASRTYNFTVTNSNGTYTGTASAWLKKGEYVPATGLKLIKQ